MSRKVLLTLLLALASLPPSARADLATELGNAESAARLDALTRAPESRNRATLLHLGIRSKPMRFKLLSEAKHYLFITVPYWFNDDNGREFFSAVERKRLDMPYFDFRVLQDWTSPVSSKDPLGTQMISWLNKESGGNALLWNPLWEFRPWSADIIRNRIHDKLFIVDGTKLLMGGMNIADDYLEGGLTDKGWHDTDILFEGPVAQQAARDFLHPFLLQKYLDRRSNWFPEKYHPALQDIFYWDPGENPDGTPVRIGMENYLEDSKYFPHVVEPADGVPVRLIYDNPLVDRDPHTRKQYSKVMDTLEYLVAKAKTSVRLFIAYPTTSARMTAILSGAAKRGVKVEVIANSRQSTDMGSLDYLSAMVSVRRMLDAGVKFYEWQGHADLEAFERSHHCKNDGYWPGRTIHTKAVMIDGAVTMIGSHNLNVRSEEMNSEVMALVRDPQITRELNAVFDYDLDTGTDRSFSCGGKVYPDARPPRTRPFTAATIEVMFRKAGLWLKFLHLLEPVM